VIDQFPQIVARLQRFAATARLDLGDAEIPGKGIRPLGGQQ
jgi:hypothetical protein